MLHHYRAIQRILVVPVDHRFLDGHVIPVNPVDLAYPLHQASQLFQGYQGALGFPVVLVVLGVLVYHVLFVRRDLVYQVVPYDQVARVNPYLLEGLYVQEGHFFLDFLVFQAVQWTQVDLLVQVLRIFLALLVDIEYRRG